MSHKIHLELSRRNLMKYAGNMILFAPLMRAFADTQVFGDDAPPKRGVFFYFPSGSIPGKFAPAAGPLGAMNDMTMPLSGVAKDLIILRDTNYKTSMSHQGGMLYCLTGMPDLKGGKSIDQYLGEKFRGSLTDVVRLGVATHWDGGTDLQSCSWLKAGQYALRTDNPAKAFAELFGGAAPAPMPGTPSGQMPGPTVPTAGILPDNRLSIIDANVQQLKTLQTKLASIEKEKLDSHLTALRELEMRTKAMIQPATGGMTGGPTNTGATSVGCTKSINVGKFTAKDSQAPLQVGNIESVIDIQTEIAAQALACRLTNILLLQIGHSVWEMSFSGQPGGGKGQHSTSHYDGEGTPAQHIANQQWMMKKFAKLVETLGKFPEGDKTVLYNSLCMAFSEFGDSANHAFTNVPIVFAGQQGGLFKTGRCVSGGGASHNQTLVSILQSFGLADNTYGQADLGSGPMPGLRA